jgi:hypothetical protein
VVTALLIHRHQPPTTNHPPAHSLLFTSACRLSSSLE